MADMFIRTRASAIIGIIKSECGFCIQKDLGFLFVCVLTVGSSLSHSQGSLNFVFDEVPNNQVYIEHKDQRKTPS